MSRKQRTRHSNMEQRFGGYVKIYNGRLLLGFLLSLLLCKKIHTEGEFCAPSRAVVFSRAQTGVRLFVLVDLHGADLDGQDCAELNAGGLVAMEALTWFVKDLNEKDNIPGIPIGYEVYDTCGKAEKVNQIMSSVLNEKELCAQDTLQFGIIMTSHSESTQAGIKWMSLLKIPHLVIPEDGHPVLPAEHVEGFGPYTLAVPGASDVVIKSLSEILGYMNTSYVVTVSGGLRMKELATQFRFDAFNENICIPKHIHLDSPKDGNWRSRIYKEVSSYPNIKVVVSFLEEEDIVPFRRDIAKSDKVAEYFWLLVSNSSQEINSQWDKELIDQAHNFLFIQPHFIQQSKLKEYFLNKTRKASSKLSSNMVEYIETTQRCYFDSPKPGRSKHCSDIQPEEIANNYREDPRVNHVIKGLMAIATSVGDAWTRHCWMVEGMCEGLANLEPDEVMNYLTNVKATYGKRNGDRMTIRFTDGIMARGVSINILTFGPHGTKINFLGVSDGGRLRMNQSAFEIIKANLTNHNCDKCNECRSVDVEEVLYSDQEASAYFTGVFDSPPEDSTCSLLRVQALETLYLGLQMEKDRGDDRFRGVDYGVLILQRQGIYFSKIEHTKHLPADMLVPPVHTLGTVEVSLSPDRLADDDHSQREYVDERPTNVKSNKVIGIAKYLKSQNIKYASIVYSGSRDTYTSFRRLLTQHNVCVAAAVNVAMVQERGEPLETDIIQITLQLLSETGKAPIALILMDDMPLIEMIISGFRQLDPSVSYTWVIADSVTLDWTMVSPNDNILLLSPPSKYQNAIQDHLNQLTGYDIAVKTWLADYYRACTREKKPADITVIDDPVLLYGILMAIQNVVEDSNEAYEKHCGGGGLCEGYSSSDALPKKTVMYQKTKPPKLNFNLPWEIVEHMWVGGDWRAHSLGTIDEKGNLHGVGVTNDKSEKPQTECDGWCPHCSGCSDLLAPEPAPMIRGDVVIAAILHVHKPGDTPLSCGTICYDNEDMQLVEGFLYALQTAKKRYPDLHFWKKAWLGGIILDTCSSMTKAVQQITNLEGCQFSYEYPNTTDILHPQSVFAYLSTDAVDGLGEVVHNLDKVIVGPGISGTHEHGGGESPVEILSYYVKLGAAMIDLLRTFNWTYVAIVLSEKEANEATADIFIEMIEGSEICVGSLQVIKEDTSTNEVVEELGRLKDVYVVILFTSSVDTIKLLHSVKKMRYPSKHFQWILVDANRDAVFVEEIREYAVGAIAIKSIAEADPEFRKHYERLNPNSNTQNPWFKDFWERKFQCRLDINPDGADKKQFKLCSGREVLSLDPPHPLIPYIFESVDLIVHALDSVISEQCPDGKSLCNALIDKEKISHLIRERLHEAVKEPWTLHSSKQQTLTEFLLQSFQMISPGKYEYIQIAKYQRDSIDIETKVDFIVNEQEKTPTFTCSDCMCLNLSAGKGWRHHVHGMSSTKHRLQNYHTSYSSAIWVTVVLTIAGIGIIVCCVIMGYVIYKRFTKKVQDGNMVTGLLLLLGIALLYGSTFTFAAPAGQISCGLRAFLVAFAYTFSYAVILIKAMHLRSVRCLGIGGKVSSFNEFITLIFIVSVQVAVSIQWWVYHSPSSDLSQQDKTLVCTYSKLQYAQIFIYPLVLLLLTALYSITVRQMKQNCHEIKFLLIACWLCILSSFIWYIVLVVVTEKFREPTICVGALVCATLMLVAIFLPKVHLLATMKYNLNKFTFDGLGRHFRGTPATTSSADFTFYDVSGVRPKSVNSRVNYAESRDNDTRNNYKF